MSDNPTLAAPLSELDPADRALLELRFRRSLDDDELATLLGIGRGEVERRYAAVLDHLAGPDEDARRRIEDELERELGPAPRHGESGPAFRMRRAAGAGEARGNGGEAPRGGSQGRLVRLGGAGGGRGPRKRLGPLRRARRGHRRGPGRGTRRPGRGTIALGVLAAAIVATPFVIALSRAVDGPGGSAEQSARDGGAGSPRRPSAPEGDRGQVAAATAAGAAFGATELRSVSPSYPDAAGTVRVAGSGEARRLVLTFRNLIAPRGDYVVWLYNDDDDAVSLVRFAVRAERLTVELPPGTERYRSVDLSDEPDTGGPGHDGVSVIRGPLPKRSPAAAPAR